MTPAELVSIGHRLYGRKRWKTMLAQALGVDRTTIHRLTTRDKIPGPYEIAVNAIWANAQARSRLEKEARKLIRQRAGKLMPLKPRKTRSDKKEKVDEPAARQGTGEVDGATASSPVPDRGHQADVRAEFDAGNISTKD